MDIVRFDLGVHLPDLQALVNRHVGAVIPGWGVTREFLAEGFGAPVRDLDAGDTLCVLAGGRVVAALRYHVYGEGPGVRDYHRGLGVVDGLLVDPEHVSAGTELLAAARARLQRLGARREAASWDIGLPSLYGVADTWTHIVAALQAAGFVAGTDAYWVEEVWGGPLPAEPVSPAASPEGVEIRRGVGEEGTQFSAIAQGAEIGHCDCVPGLSRGGRLPLLATWGAIADLFVEEEWRGRGVGAALANGAVAWMRLAGCARVVVSVPEPADSPEAHRFYPRFGWSRWARQYKVWQPAGPPSPLPVPAAP